MKRFLAAALASGLAVIAIPTALAAKPIKERTVSGPFTIGAAACGFLVEVDPTRQDQLLIWEFSDGRQAFNFAFAGTITNVATGTTVNINLSGHNTVVEAADGSSTFIATGGTILFEPGSLLLVKGRVVDTFNADGDLVSETITGHTVDMCEVLAAAA
jgi:hypothetical protein